MAELLAVKGWSTTHSLGLHLRDTLTDEYYVVCDPMVRGVSLDALVVGPQGLFVLHARDWGGTVRPARRGPWRERLESGRVVSHPDPGRGARSATKALHIFLRDEFPSLRPMIFHYVVLTEPGVQLSAYGAANPPCVTLDTLAEEITAVVPHPKGALLDDQVRENLAVALRDRALTATQHASQPFIFRSSGLIGMGRKVWTIRQALKHIDRCPEDGVHHLRNGTLERWFSGQGAFHLAALARDVMHTAERDPRVSLESFLLGTGLVRRPRLSIQPRRVNMGYVITGDMVTRHFRVCKGRGRGYVYGTLETSDPWLRVEPSAFSGSLDAVASIDTEPLLITEQPSKATIDVKSNASEDPISVPVRLHVVAMPAPVNRYLLRPLVGLILAGLIGASWGWAAGRGSIQVPAWLWPGSSSPSPGASWAILTGLLWALMGAIRGFLQNPAWPIAYAAARWLRRTLAWGTILSLLAALVRCFGTWLGAAAGVSLPDTIRASVTLLAVALAVLPAVAGEIQAARRRQDDTGELAEARGLRRALSGAIGVALAFVVLAGVRLVGPTLGRNGYDIDDTLASVQHWASGQWVQWEAAFNGYVDQFYVRYHDRRAPVSSTPTPSTRPTAPVEGEGGS